MAAQNDRLNRTEKYPIVGFIDAIHSRSLKVDRLGKVNDSLAQPD